jgi:alkylhydroperoxidase/carboxymuconolactone decarboxylase family protein YurZ
LVTLAVAWTLKDNQEVAGAVAQARQVGVSVDEMEQVKTLVLVMLESLAEGMAEEDGALSAHQRALVTLAVAWTLEDSAGVTEAVAQARQVGVSGDEMEQVKTLVILQRARRVASLG